MTQFNKPGEPERAVLMSLQAAANTAAAYLPQSLYLRTVASVLLALQNGQVDAAVSAMTDLRTTTMADTESEGW